MTDTRPAWNQYQGSDGLPPAPSHLSDESQDLWRDTVAMHEFEPRHLVTLLVALEALDRMREAQASIREEGIIVVGRFGPKTHPAIAIEKDCRIAYLRAIRELGLDVERAPESRPPSVWD